MTYSTTATSIRGKYPTYGPIYSEKYSKHYTDKWIFEDLMPGDIFKCIKGKMCGTRMLLSQIDYKKRHVLLTYYCGSFGIKALALNEEDFHEHFNFVAWHS